MTRVAARTVELKALRELILEECRSQQKWIGREACERIARDLGVPDIHQAMVHILPQIYREFQALDDNCFQRPPTV